MQRQRLEKRNNDVSRAWENLDLTLYSQETNKKDENAIIYFVLSPGTTEATCCPNLSASYHMCMEYNVCPKWINEDRCLKTIPAERNVFVLSAFSGRAYDHLLRFYNSIQFEIIGPQCIRLSLESKDHVPIRSKGHPMFTLTMQDIIITLSGFSDRRAEKEELTALVEKMNGTISPLFSLGTTHIVANSLLTDKCMSAYLKEKPVMTSEWIRAAWRDSQKDLIQATDPKYVTYACPIFYRLNICVSQLPSVKKNALKNIIEANGGTYFTQLARETVNVLVIPSPSGEKYRYAREWNIHCVSPDWVEMCKATGHILPFKDFSVNGIINGIMSSTPTKDYKPNLYEGSINMCSIIPNASKFEVDATRNSSKHDSMSVTLDNDMVDVVRRASDEGPFLDGCKIYLCGTDSMEQVRKLLNGSGATRLSRLNDQVTHVLIIGSKIGEEDMNRIQNLKARPHLVNINWLIESAKKGCPADEEMYGFNPESEKIVPVPQNQSQSCEIADEPINDQVVVEDHSLVEGIANSGKKSSFVVVRALSQRNKLAMPSQEVNLKENTHGAHEGEENETTCNVPFSGLKFVVKLTEQAEKKIVAEGICDLNGEIVEDNFDIAILPVTYTKEPSLMGKKCYTKFWVGDCSEAKTIDIPDFQYHHPVPKFNRMKSTLEDVVIAISQYGNSEKNYLATLAVEMGAIYQDVFSRKKTHTAHRSTHLICSVAENEKCVAAKRWDVPIVMSDWIYDCYQNKKKLPITKYHPGIKKDDSDSTMNCIPMTPKAINSTTNKVAQKMSAVTSIAFYPPSTTKFVKPPVYGNAFLTPKSMKRKSTESNTSIASVSDSESDANTPIGRELRSKLNLSELDLVPPKSVEDSPLLWGLSRESSRQLKRGLNFACSNSPGPDLSSVLINVKKRTPDSVLMGGVWADINAFISQPKTSISPSPKTFTGRLPIVRVSMKNDATKNSKEIIRRTQKCVEDNSNDEESRTKRRKTSESSTGDDREHDDVAMEICPINAAKQITSETPCYSSSTNNQVVLERVMTNVTAFISKKCENAENINKIITDLGGSVTTELKSPELTHLIYQGKSAHMSREVKTVSNSDVKVVDPIWVFKCKEKMTLLNESWFRPGKIVEIEASPEKISSSKFSLDALENLVQQQDVEIPEDIENACDESQTQGKTIKYKKGDILKAKDEDSETEGDYNVEWVNEMGGHCNDPKSNVISKVKISDAKNTRAKEILIGEKVDQNSAQNERPKMSNEDAKDTKSMETKSDTGINVITEQIEDLNGKPHRITRSRSTAQFTGNNINQATNVKKPLKSVQQAVVESDSAIESLGPNPVFMISALNDHYKRQASETFERLGGSLSSGAVFDADAHATIACSLARSEKVLATVASGKRLLKETYIDACQKSNKFVSPTKHLWAKEDAKNELELQVVNAAKYWFDRISKDPTDKPYSKYKIFLRIKNIEAMTRLVLSGGGSITKDVAEANLIIQDKETRSNSNPNDAVIQSATYLSKILFTPNK